MKRPKLEHTRNTAIQSIGGRSVSVYKYSKMQDEYIDYLESQQRELLIHFHEWNKINRIYPLPDNSSFVVDAYLRQTKGK